MWGQTTSQSGTRAGPTPWLAGHTLSQFWPRLDGYAPKSVYKSITCPRSGGDQEEWPASHVDGCPAAHHLQTDSIESVEAPLDLYIRILTVEFIHTTLFLQFSTCKGSGLVVEAQAKPFQESRAGLSLRSNSESSLGDRWALVSLPFIIDFES
jgi:hypothetical protein